MTAKEDWNPDRACEEMAELFSRADKIIKQPHYQEAVSTGELETPSADASQTTDFQSQGIHQSCQIPDTSRITSIA